MMSCSRWPVYLRALLLPLALALGACGDGGSYPTPAAGASSSPVPTPSPTATVPPGVPGSFAWSSSDVLLSPIGDPTHDPISIKDPSVVYYNGNWHVYASSVTSAGSYGMVYIRFRDWEHTASATVYYMDQNPSLAGYHAAPQLFYFRPQNKWYLVYQSGPPQYSTNDDPGDPAGWTAPASFFAGEPATVTRNKGRGGWLDFWVICDTTDCCLFFSDDNGHWYRSRTAISSFPLGFSEPVVVLQDADPFRLFEASNVYAMKGTGRYLALVEAFDAASGGHRYFRSWTADRLDGSWTPLQDTYATPFASYANVAFTTQPAWTRDISHGEMIRDGYDETLTIDPAQLRFLYQGVSPDAAGLPYNSLPWRLGLLSSR
jgi:endo-1,4-beta-xylanase